MWRGSHDETAQYLSEHVEGELRGLRRWRILRHLARCQPCSAALHSLVRTLEGLRALGRTELEPKPSVAEAVVVRIRSERGSGR